jgi:hypothetical protein
MRKVTVADGVLHQLRTVQLRMTHALAMQPAGMTPPLQHANIITSYDPARAHIYI